MLTHARLKSLLLTQEIGISLGWIYLCMGVLIGS